MKPWLVHIERLDIDEWTINTTAPDADRVTHARYYNCHEVEIEAMLSNHQEEQMETWYCADEESAQLLAKHFARKLPGRNINVYEIRSVVRSAPSEPAVAKYTAKGLVPV